MFPDATFCLVCCIHTMSVGAFMSRLMHAVHLRLHSERTLSKDACIVPYPVVEYAFPSTRLNIP